MPFIIALLVIGAIWYYMILRGRLTVRAAGYMVALEQGATPEVANSYAFSIDLYQAARSKHEVMLVVREAYGGSQLALISDARLMGFKG